MCIKYIESNIPDNFQLHVHHYHCGNSSKRQRHGKEYMTAAWITNKSGDTVGSGVAYCSNKDNPRRSVGREIATGRAMQELFDREGHTYSPSFGEH